MTTDQVIRPLAATQRALHHAEALVSTLSHASRTVVDGTRSGPDSKDVELAERISHAVVGIDELRTAVSQLPDEVVTRRGSELIGAELDGATKWAAIAQEQAGRGPRPWLLSGDESQFGRGAKPAEMFDRSTIAHYSSVEHALTVADSHLGSVHRLVQPGGLGAWLANADQLSDELRSLSSGTSGDVSELTSKIGTMRSAMSDALAAEVEKLRPRLGDELQHASALAAERGNLLKELRSSPSASTHARYAEVDAQLLKLHETPGMWRTVHLNNAIGALDDLSSTLQDARVRRVLESGDMPASGVTRFRAQGIEGPMRNAKAYLELAMRDRPHDQGSTVARLVPVSTLEKLAAR
jgi:hypothetical protein